MNWTFPAKNILEEEMRFSPNIGKTKERQETREFT
jgi:hypothetical protein